MDRKKVKYIYYIFGAQLILQIIFLILGVNFRSENSTISSSVLSMLTKVQTTNHIQNFIWLFTQNIAVMFVLFWLSYLSFGVIGTFWCINNTFMLGALAKVYLLVVDYAWLALVFMALELIATTIVMIFSTKFRYERFKAKKAFAGNDEMYKKTKKQQEKSILVVFAVIAGLLLIAAVLETIVLGTIV